MKLIKTLNSCLFLSLIIGMSLLSCNNQPKNGVEFLTNNTTELGFSTVNGSLVSMKNLGESQELLDNLEEQGPIWEIEILSETGPMTIDPSAASGFSITRIGQAKGNTESNGGTLMLEWDGFSTALSKNLRVVASVNLESDQGMSQWSIVLEGTKGMKIKQLSYPRIHGIKDIGQEYLAIPMWLGELIHGPRESLIKQRAESLARGQNGESQYFFDYPGPLSLQMMALYDPQNYGIYLASNDTAAYSKSFLLSLDEGENLMYEQINYPPMDENKDQYSPAYEAVIGMFKGDWITAAEIYKEWGKEQAWSKDSRFSNDLVQPWLKETALWVWNRSTSDKVLSPAIDLKEVSGLPVSVFWHWWHNCSYDDGFPEYIPPREGKDPFVRAMKKANENGINAIVYMNSFQWGTETQSWIDEGAEQFAVKDINGNLRRHVYNIFTDKSLTNMCMATDFWQSKYTSLSDSVVNVFQTNGVYMDQACLSRRCYDETHDHTRGGGNYWVNGFGKLTERIRNKTAQTNNSVLAGEGASEAWLPYLDAFLTLQVSRERYAGVGNKEPIPFFPMVYHKYAILYGSYSSLLVPPYDELWPEEFAPKEPEALLSKDFNNQFLMEQARSFVWGLQPTIANYRDFLPQERKEEIKFLVNLASVRFESLKYLLYGEMLRSPEMEVPSAEIDISRLSIYAGKKGESVSVFKKVVPLVYSGAWKADDGNIALAIANIGEDAYEVNLKLSASDYNLSASGEIYVIDVDGRKVIGSYDDGQIVINHSLGSSSVCILEIVNE